MYKSFIILFTFVLFSCSGENETLTINNPKIKTALQKKNKEYADIILANCKKDILSKAELYVDSLVSAEIIFQLSDSIVFPEKPLKPLSIGKIIVSDTIIAKPIFPKK